MPDLNDFRADIDRAEREALEAQDRRDEAIVLAIENGNRGTQAQIAAEYGVSREYLRQLARRYYRSITRYDGPSAYITMPADNVVAGRTYEIRDTDKTTVLATVPGQALLDARADQFAAYIQEDPTRTNIRLVDVAEFLPTAR